MLREYRIYGLLVILYGGSTLLLTHPMVGKWGDHLFGDGDSYFMPWVLAWVYHSLADIPSTLFHANIFYPASNTLAFSEHFLSAQLLFAPGYYLTENPILAYNLVLLGSFVLCGITMFALVRHLTGDGVAGLISGFFFAFAPVRFAHYPHLQLILIWWSPLALLFLERYLLKPSWTDFVLFTLTFWLQFLSSTYLGVYLGTMALLRVTYAGWQERSLIWNRHVIGKLAFLGVGSFAVLTPFVWPYVQVSRQWHYTRSLQENIHSSAELTSYLYAFPGHYLYGGLLSGFAYVSWPKYLLLGFLPLILASLGAWLACRPNPALPRVVVRVGRAYVILGVAALILSLGPFLIWRGQITDIPLPYWLFYHFVPGYQAMRIPARFGLWVGLAVSVLAGVGLYWLRALVRTRFPQGKLRPLMQGGMMAVIIPALLLESYTLTRPLPVAVNEHIPAVYRFLAREGDRSPLIELPMPKQGWRDEIHWQEAKRTYYSIYHRRPMANGYSGFVPPSFEAVRELANKGPRVEVIEALAALGIRTIILHLDEMAGAERQAWHEADIRALGLQLIAQFDADIVLKIAAAPEREILPGLEIGHHRPMHGAIP